MADVTSVPRRIVDVSLARPASVVHASLGPGRPVTSPHLEVVVAAEESAESESFSSRRDAEDVVVGSALLGLDEDAQVREIHAASVRLGRQLTESPPSRVVTIARHASTLVSWDGRDRAAPRHAGPGHHHRRGVSGDSQHGVVHGARPGRRPSTALVGGFHGLTPERLVDTRQAQPVPAGCWLRVTLPPSVPADAESVALTVTSDRAVAPGFLTVHACGSSLPGLSNLNVRPEGPTSNLALVAVDATRRDVHLQRPRHRPHRRSRRLVR